jgi:multiple sugar transport system substrate-binding protein
MRVVVTRPKADGERTGAALRARGHEVLLAPLMTVEPIAADLAGNWGGVVGTRANAPGGPLVIGEDVSVAPVPVPEEGDTSFTTFGGRAALIMKTTPEREARAWHFLQFLMEDENNYQFITELGYLPVLLSLQDDEFFQDPTRLPFVELLENGYVPEQFANADRAAVALQGVYQEVVVEGSIPLEDAVEAAAEAARAAVRSS